MHFYTHEDVKKAVTLGKLKIMKHPNPTYGVSQDRSVLLSDLGLLG